MGQAQPCILLPLAAQRSAKPAITSLLQVLGAGCSMLMLLLQKDELSTVDHKSCAAHHDVGCITTGDCLKVSCCWLLNCQQSQGNLTDSTCPPAAGPYQHPLIEYKKKKYEELHGGR